MSCCRNASSPFTDHSAKVEPSPENAKLKITKAALLDAFAIVHLILDAERLLRLAVLPAFLHDQTGRLCLALGRQRMRAKISLQALNGEFRELLFGLCA